MRRILLLLTLLMLPALALGEESPAIVPQALPDATSAQEVLNFLLLPDGDSLPEVQRGYIRYISQNQSRDDLFRTEYWLGGEPDSVLDLTLTERYGVEFPFHAGNMCARAVYSMALSYLGIDITPGGMSALLGTRNLDDPYDVVSGMVGVERVTPGSNVFNTMVNNYLTDERYSPVYLYFRRPNGTMHAVLVVGTIPDKGRFLVVDCNPPSADGKLHRVYFISLNRQRTEIINSTFRASLSGSRIVQIYQWRLMEDFPHTAP